MQSGIPQMTEKLQKSFTLIELLVVIAIISILASILLPSLNQAREGAKKLSCLSTYRQIYLGFELYTGNYGDYMVKPYGKREDGSRTSWHHLIYPLINNKAKTTDLDHEVDYTKLYCPSTASSNKNAKYTSYSMNAYAGHLRYWSGEYGLDEYCRRGGVKTPAQVYLAGEQEPGNTSGGYCISKAAFSNLSLYEADPEANYSKKMALRHLNGANFIFFDGHAEYAPASKIKSFTETAIGRWIPEARGE